MGQLHVGLSGAASELREHSRKREGSCLFLAHEGFGQFAYQDSIAAFHRELRQFFYPYLFADRPFTRADFDWMPAYVPRAPSGSIPIAPLLALFAAAGLLLGIGGRRIAQISGASRA